MDHSDAVARAPAVTSAKRLLALPNVPTAAESGLPNFETVSWYSIWGPVKYRQLLEKANIKIE